MALIFSLLTFVVMIVALIDIIRRDDSQIKHLPKIFWVILVILLPLAGAIIWFLLGREHENDGVSVPRIRREKSVAKPQTSTPMSDSRSTEQQIADLDREIEEWRLRAEIEKRRREGGTAKSDGA